MMWHAGLRGGIAFVLCMELGDWVDVIDGKGTKLKLRTATFMTVCVFLLGLGGTTKLMLKRRGIRCGETSANDILYKKEFGGRTRRFFESLHHSCLKPLLIGDLELKTTMDSGVIGQVISEAAQLQGRSFNDSGLGGLEGAEDRLEMQRSRSQTLSLTAADKDSSESSGDDGGLFDCLKPGGPASSDDSESDAEERSSNGKLARRPV